MKISSEKNILKEFIKQASEHGIKTEDALHRFKKRYAKKHQHPLPSNFKLQKAYEELMAEGWEGDKTLQKLMRKRKIRTLSGVSVITVLTKPYACPGKCIFCPTEPGMPKSYLSNEPGAMRAVLDDFDPYDQVKTRLNSLAKQGHETDKIEMIVLGGTFSFYPRDYQEEFVKRLFDACNGKDSKTLAEAQQLNEGTKHRIIGLSLETRSDHITEEEVIYMRELGCTKVQIGIQHTDNKILALNKREENQADHEKAMRILKNAGLKIGIHIMPNLAGSTPKQDVEMLREVFENPTYKPDYLKLYPCIVTPYSELEQWHKEGRFEAYSEEILANILIEMKKIVPEYVRIERLYRDIPGESILIGSKKTNMRQLLHDRMKKEGIVCKCIRCREIKDQAYNPDSTELKILEYDSSGGKELFISYKDTKSNKLCSLLRLRQPVHQVKKSPKKPHFIPELDGAAIIREVHTYGQQVKIGKKTGKKSESQHTGLGQKMIQKGEELAKKAGYKKIAVIAGIGTRNYYRKWGYELQGTYMTKTL